MDQDTFNNVIVVKFKARKLVQKLTYIEKVVQATRSFHEKNTQDLESNHNKNKASLVQAQQLQASTAKGKKKEKKKDKNTKTKTASKTKTKIKTKETAIITATTATSETVTTSTVAAEAKAATTAITIEDFLLKVKHNGKHCYDFSNFILDSKFKNTIKL
jgi:peptidoglycan hydrolase CwlO-like protein